jgi:hypothetical protein
LQPAKKSMALMKAESEWREENGEEEMQMASAERLANTYSLCDVKMKRRINR